MESFRSCVGTSGSVGALGSSLDQSGRGSPPVHATSMEPDLVMPPIVWAAVVVILALGLDKF